MFYGQKPTGIYRYANEILTELDGMVCKNEYELVVPSHVKNVPSFQNIKTIRYGKIQGVLWEQTALLHYLIKNKAISVNFTNSMPLLKPGIIVIHDVGYRMNPSFYRTPHGILAMLWHRFNYRWASLWKVPVITVSECSKKNITKYYQIDPKRIQVIKNAWQHVNRIVADTDAVNRYGLKQGSYFFTVGSISKRKNTGWIIETAKQLPREKFVIAGECAKNSSWGVGVIPSNVLLIGYISDSEMVGLIQKCKAFLFPSLFEGFGIPPMEALGIGAPVFVSDTESMHEIYGDSVSYIDPFAPAKELVPYRESTRVERILGMYSWKESAIEILQYINRVKNNEDKGTDGDGKKTVL